jgi:hypothetical protein
LIAGFIVAPQSFPYQPRFEQLRHALDCRLPVDAELLGNPAVRGEARARPVGMLDEDVVNRNAERADTRAVIVEHFIVDDVEAMRTGVAQFGTFRDFRLATTASRR